MLVHIYFPCSWIIQAFQRTQATHLSWTWRTRECIADIITGKDSERGVFEAREVLFPRLLRCCWRSLYLPWSGLVRQLAVSWCCRNCAQKWTISTSESTCGCLADLEAAPESVHGLQGLDAGWNPHRQEHRSPSAISAHDFVIMHQNKELRIFINCGIQYYELGQGRKGSCQINFLKY